MGWAVGTTVDAVELKKKSFFWQTGTRTINFNKIETNKLKRNNFYFNHCGKTTIDGAEEGGRGKQSVVK